MAETPKKQDNVLTLQQKFVKLREAIPALTQKAYSDSVKYKFIKISDVYEHLTPAMNAHGVNFDIIGEKATRHDTNGDELYYHSYQQQTRNGARTVWVYEADLTLRWTNADNPGDILDVTLHAIGTNDGGPDKAKGSAWTYAAKYYFFEKFGIDQGEDDPDNSDRSDGTPPDAQKQPYNASNTFGGNSTPPNNKNKAEGQQNTQKDLSDAQLTRMYKKGEAAGIAKETIDHRIASKYGHTDPRKMTRVQYEETCDALDAALTEKKEEQQNAQ